MDKIIEPPSLAPVPIPLTLSKDYGDVIHRRLHKVSEYFSFYNRQAHAFGTMPASKIFQPSTHSPVLGLSNGMGFKSVKIARIVHIPNLHQTSPSISIIIMPCSIGPSDTSTSEHLLVAVKTPSEAQEYSRVRLNLDWSKTYSMGDGELCSTL